MKIHRFLSNYIETEGSVFIENSDLVHQVKNVLKLHSNEEIILTDGIGNDVRIVIKEISKNSIIGSVVEKINTHKKSHRVYLYLSTLKKENFELVAQKVTEIGVTSIVPLESDRTIKTGFKEDRLKTIIKEALEQSGQSYLPTLGEKIRFEDALNKSPGEKFILHMDGFPFDKLEEFGEDVSIFVGPEGGWSEAEIQKAKDLGIKTISIGDSTLRAETAAIIASFLFVNKK